MDGNETTPQKRIDKMFAMLLGIQGVAESRLSLGPDNGFMEAVNDMCEVFLDEVQDWQIEISSR